MANNNTRRITDLKLVFYRFSIIIQGYQESNLYKLINQPLIKKISYIKLLRNMSKTVSIY